MNHQITTIPADYRPAPRSGYGWYMEPTPGSPIGTIAVTASELVSLAKTFDRSTLNPEQRKWFDRWYDTRFKDKGDNDPKWTGAKNEQEARERLTHGWAEGVQKITDLSTPIRALVPQAVSIRRKQQWQAEGASLNIDRALRGEWEQAWRGCTRRGRVGSGVVTIACQFSFSAMVSPESLAWNGTAAAALSDALEEAGWQTRVLGLGLVQANTKGYALYAVEAKAAGEPMNLSVMAGTLATASAYRYFGIGLAAFGPGGTHEGYGSVCSIEDAATLAAQLGVCDAVDVLIPVVGDKTQALAACKAGVEAVNLRAEGTIDEFSQEDA